MPTVLIDEADTFLNNSDELRGIVNAGHSKSTAYVIRTVGDKHEPKQFNVYAPKAIALIGKPRDTIIDRSIQIELRRKLPHETVERIDTKSDFYLDLKRKCQRWADDNFMKVELCRPTHLQTSNDRTADNYEPLLAITSVIGGACSDRIRKSATLLNPDEANESSVGAMLLQDIKMIFDECKSDRVSSAVMAEALNKMEDRPWPEWRKGFPMTTTQLARQLKKFDIRPNLSRHGADPSRGYDLKDFHDAFSRYTPSEVLHSLQTNIINRLEENQTVTERNPVTLSKQSNPLESLDCNTCNTLTGGEEVVQTTLEEWGGAYGR
jgi:putative DNA primase/helicase